MKYLFCALATLSCLTYSLYGDNEPAIDLFDYSNVSIDIDYPPPSYTFAVKVDGIKKADIQEGFYEEDSIGFAEAYGQLGISLYSDDEIQETAYATVSFMATKVEWEHNPWFAQQRFDTFGMSLAATSKRFCNWSLRGQFDINVEADQWTWNYTYYNLLAWGRYEYFPCVGVHIGAIVQAGIGMNYIYPIIGADWRLTDQWKLSFVYPLNMSLTYLYNNNLSVILAARVFDSRHKANKHESHQGSTVRYRNLGTELGIQYENCYMTANIHAGYTFVGELRIADHHGHHAHHYSLDPAPYAGAEFLTKF